MNFQKFQLNWGSSKHFTSPKQLSAWRKLFSPPPDKNILHLWNKKFHAEIYRSIKIFAFQGLPECSSWASWNGAVQKFFLTPTRNMFLAVLREYIFYKVEWVKVCKMGELHCCHGCHGFETFYQKNLNLLEKRKDEVFNCLLYWSKFSFFRTVLGHFLTSVVLKFFVVAWRWCSRFLIRPPTKKTSYALL